MACGSVFCHHEAMKMKPKTEELLYSLFWCMDMLANPTFRNLTDSVRELGLSQGFSAPN